VHRLEEATGAAAPAVSADAAGASGGGVVAGGADGDAVAEAAAAAAASAAVSERPHFGQDTQPACSGARQSGQRPWVNGSVTPQNGQAATPLSMNFVQNGHGCL
jgi:hypothetical protein